MTMDNQESVAYLSSLLGKTLRIHISDRRLFVGQMKCTDKVSVLHFRVMFVQADKHGGSQCYTWKCS